MQFKLDRMKPALQEYHLRVYPNVTETINEWGERRVYLTYSDDNPAGYGWF